VWATLLDALAAYTAETIAVVTGVVGPRERLVVFGGGSTSPPWLAAKARHSPLPVWRSTTAHAVARGAALQAGVAAGWWTTLDEAPAVDVEPVPGRVSPGGKWGGDVPPVGTRPIPAEQPSGPGSPEQGAA
jgi:xylulokinase